jgi:hypothetical protein
MYYTFTAAIDNSYQDMKVSIVEADSLRVATALFEHRVITDLVDDDMTVEDAEEIGVQIVSCVRTSSKPDLLRIA